MFTLEQQLSAIDKIPPMYSNPAECVQNKQTNKQKPNKNMPNIQTVKEEEGKATVLSFVPYRFFSCLEKRICSEIATAHQFSPELWDFRFFDVSVLVMAGVICLYLNCWTSSTFRFWRPLIGNSSDIFTPTVGFPLFLDVGGHYE